MPRSLAYGNGHMLVQVDACLNIRDIFWPYVGQFNHGADGGLRWGVWVGDHLSWLDAGGWEFAPGYEAGTLVGASNAVHRDSGRKLEIIDAISPSLPVFQRTLRWADSSEPVRVYVSVDLRLNESDIGDTVLYHPDSHGLVQFKNKAAIWIGSPNMDQWATGVRDEHGVSHAWRDAEDCQLSGRGIDQGSIDAVVGFTGEIVAVGLTCGESLWEATTLATNMVRHGMDAFLSAARERRSEGTVLEDEELNRFYHQSLLIIRSQSDDGGAILAANDGDILKTNRATYSYMWPRDGALVARALDRAGHVDLSRAWLEFSARLVTPEQPYWLHKYSPDGSFGATWHPWWLDGERVLPIQEDETSLTVYAFAEHCLSTHPEREWVDQHWDALLARPCEFMRFYRDPSTGLPKPSWDLWEERRGIHVYTIASIIAAFRSCAKLEKQLGKADSGYHQTADEFTDALLRHLVDPETGRFWRCLQAGQPDRTVDSASLAVGLLDVLPMDHPSVVATRHAVEEKLRIRDGIDGIARYENDCYFRKVDHQPGNPWIICTMWVAQSAIKAATTREELVPVLEWIRWGRERATGAYVLSEQYHPDTGEALSVSPLTWSHAEVVRTCLDYADRLKGLSS